MKKILFVIPSFAIGGITSSLQSLLSSLDYNKIEVDLFCRQKIGPMQDAYPKCTIMPENLWLSTRIIEGGVVKKALFLCLRGVKVIGRMLKMDMNKTYGRIGGKQMKTIMYDAVISFHEGLSPVVCYFPAKKRIAWIHSDYARYQAMVCQDELNYYELYDNIVCVSTYAKTVFDHIYPTLSNKVRAIHNVIDIKNIKAKSLDVSNLDERFDTSQFVIISVGRIDPVKQFDKIPHIAASIKQHTECRFKWYIIGGSRGFGEDENRILKNIEECGVQDEVYLLGEKNNVYPYMAASNVYVCTSKSESFPLAINEAKVLNVPIVSNNFPSASESIVDGKDGIITPIDNMANVIIEMMKDGCNMILDGIIDNNTPLNQFYDLLECDR